MMNAQTRAVSAVSPLSRGFGFAVRVLPTCHLPNLAYICGPPRLEGLAASVVCAARTTVSDGPCARRKVRHG